MSFLSLVSYIFRGAEQRLMGLISLASRSNSGGNENKAAVQDGEERTSD